MPALLSVGQVGVSITAGLYEGATFYFLLTIPPSYPFHGELSLDKSTKHILTLGTRQGDMQAVLEHVLYFILYLFVNRYVLIWLTSLESKRCRKANIMYEYGFILL